MTGGFTSELWDGIADIYSAILAHPFVTGLADGSLPRESFEFYVIQDALYLRKYAQALAAVAARAPEPAATEMFARHAAGIVSAELILHDSLLADLGIEQGQVGQTREAPTTLAYTSYLIATTSMGSYGDGVAAVLPCYWIYAEVGKHLLTLGSPNPSYQRWIDTYGAGDFEAEVREVIGAADNLADGLAAPERDRFRRHFNTTSRYEWMFWDMGYRRENWPV
jgi:thiaminase (transcriptional activator TenA)